MGMPVSIAKRLRVLTEIQSKNLCRERLEHEG